MAYRSERVGSIRRPSLQIDPLHTGEQLNPTSQNSSTTIVSPAVDLSQSPSESRDAEGLDFESERRDSLIGPQRSAPSLKADKEKRKRSRVTPEQLVHLERYFAMDRSPTAARRKDISDHLGMHERQTQIWFQNRYVVFIASLLKNLISHIITAVPKPSCKMEDTTTGWIAPSFIRMHHPNFPQVSKATFTTLSTRKNVSVSHTPQNPSLLNYSL